MKKLPIFALAVGLLAPSISLAGDAPAPVPALLDQATISAGMQAISPWVAACSSGQGGTVKLGMKVGADGAVVSIEVKAAPDSAMGSCVAAAVFKAVFAKTRAGGTFLYPFAVGPAQGSAPSPTPVPVPEFLDRATISAGMQAISPWVAVCASGQGGTVKIGVKVSADGGVVSADVKAAPEPAMGRCVADAVYRASFGKTRAGSTFLYPFTVGPARVPAPAPIAETLDQAAISAGMQSISPSWWAACATDKHGTVKVKVAVGADGGVVRVEVKASPDPALGRCVADVVYKAFFNKTRVGGTFVYPFVF